MQPAEVVGRIAGILTAYNHKFGGGPKTAEEALEEIAALVERYFDNIPELKHMFGIPIIFRK